MYPVAYEQSPPVERDRVTVFFRIIMVIPHFIVAFFYGLAFVCAVIAAWFALLFTGRWPAGLYDFCAGFLRFATRLNGYAYLVTDEFPPFDGGEHPDYPIRAIIAAPKEEYDRIKVLFRGILMIPILIVQYVMGLWLGAVGLVLWLAAVFTGRTSQGLTDAMRLPMAYYVRATAYFGLLTEDWPPFDPATPPQPAAASAPEAPPAASPS
jgi:hypothetical protein